MKKTFQICRSNRNGEKDVSDSSEDGNIHKNSDKDMKRGAIHLPMSQLKPSGRWYNSEKNISSTSNGSKIRSQKRHFKNVSSKHPTSRLVSEVINEVLNFKGKTSPKSEESKILQNNKEKICSNTERIHPDVSNIFNKDDSIIEGIPEQRECIISQSTRDSEGSDTVKDTKSEKITELSIDSKIKNASTEDTAVSSDSENTSSDGNGSFEPKRSRVKEDSSDEISREAHDSNIMEADKPEMDEAVHKTSASDISLLNRCNGIIRISNKTVLVDFISPRLLENPLDVHRVMVNLLGFKTTDFVGITKDKIKKRYSFLIFEEPLREFLRNNPKTEAVRLVPWDISHFQDRVALATIISLNSSNTIECHIDFKKAAKKLLNCLLGNSKELYTQFCYNETSTDNKDVKNEATHLSDPVNQEKNLNSNLTSSGEKKIKIHNILNKKNHFKEKISNDRRMSAEEERQKKFFQMMESFFTGAKEQKEPKEAPAKKNPVPDREKAKNKILERCLGIKNPGKKYVVAMVNTTANITSYKEIKDVLILLFGIKPNEFCGLTRSNFAPKFNMLIEAEALMRYMRASPHPEAGNISPWDEKDLKVLMSELAIVCASVTTNSKNAMSKRLANRILELSRSSDQTELQQLIILPQDGIGDIEE